MRNYGDDPSTEQVRAANQADAAALSDPATSARHLCAIYGIQYRQVFGLLRLLDNRPIHEATETALKMSSYGTLAVEPILTQLARAFAVDLAGAA